ncbi:hypothetical protein Tco_0174354 [Tanacetum coccineum]
MLHLSPLDVLMNSNARVYFNDDFTLCNDNPFFDEEFEDISSLDPLELTTVIDEPTLQVALPSPYLVVLGDEKIDLLLRDDLDTLLMGDREIDLNACRDIEELERLLANDHVPVPRVFDEPLGNSDSMSRPIETSDLILKELTVEIGLDDSIPIEIDDRNYDSEGSGYHQKGRKPSQNDKTEHGMEKTVQNQGQSPKMPKSESILKNQQNQLVYEPNHGNNYDFICFDQPPQYHIDQSPPQELDSHSYFLHLAMENNRILEELLRTSNTNSLVGVGVPEGSDDYTEVTYDKEQCLSDHYTAPVTPPAYTPSISFLATVEPIDILLMGDEVISTIIERENDEFIKCRIPLTLHFIQSITKSD